MSLPWCIPGHLNFGPRRMFPKMFLAKWRIQKLFLQLQKKKIQLKKKETKVAPPEDPEVVPPAQEGDPSCSSRGSRSCSSSTRRRPKLLLPRFQKLFLQLPETSQRSHPP